MYDGIVHVNQKPDDQITTKKQLFMVDAYKSKQEIIRFLDSYIYPISHLDFEPFFHPKAKYVCTGMIADALLNDKAPSDCLRKWWERYWSHGDYGKHFAIWLASRPAEPNNRMGNGRAMRDCPCGWLYLHYHGAIKADIRN